MSAPQSCYFHFEGRIYTMNGFDGEMMLAILNDREPYYWGA